MWGWSLWAPTGDLDPGSGRLTNWSLRLDRSNVSCESSMAQKPFRVGQTIWLVIKLKHPSRNFQT